MSFGAKPMGPPPIRPRPPSRGEVAFAVGSRALITPTGNAGQVQLLDEDGMPVDRSLRGNLEVMFTAWRPRRSAPPRYRVCSADQVEGWIDAANLRRLPPPPPPAPIAVTAPPPPPPVAKQLKKPAPKAVVAKAAAPKPAAAKPIAAKPVAAKPEPKPQPAAKPKPVAKTAPAKPAPQPKKAAKPAASAKAASARAKTAAKPKKAGRASKRTR